MLKNTITPLFTKNLNDRLINIFRRGSTTYYYSSIFFPKEIKKDVFSLYAFVRTADDYVDQIPQDKKSFLKFRDLVFKGLDGQRSNNYIIDKYLAVSKKKDFNSQWIIDFLEAMETDLHKKTYRTVNEVTEYTHGSAEVIGLMMASILGLPRESYQYARLQGRAMQYANFIRDIEIDNRLGRTYLPQKDIKKFGLSSLKRKDIENNPHEFCKFIEFQVNRYFRWQRKAEKGYKYIPKRYLVPIKTASDMYSWTMLEILKDPMQIYEREVKPNKTRVVSRVLYNSVFY